MNSEWIEWDGKDFPPIAEDAQGYVQFIGETRARALSRGISTISFWPWYGEDEEPCIVAYRIIQP
jgi:hypothetical protein